MQMFKELQINRTDLGKFKTAGFTLIELIIVVVIIGILTAITIVGVRGARESSVVTACKADAVTLLKAIETFRLREGSYPNDLEVGDSLSSEDVQLMINAAYLRTNILSISQEFNLSATIGTNGASVRGSFTSPAITQTCKAP